jgi:pectate lyase C
MSGVYPSTERLWEYNNSGPGAQVNSSRTQLSDSQAAGYTVSNILQGQDNWNPEALVGSISPGADTDPVGDDGGGDVTNGAITGASCISTGTVTVRQTIVVSSGVYDGKCQTFVPVGLGSGDQSEDQLPVFRVENGATLKNVIIGKPGVDGIHLYNSATLDNITWTDVGEDACTVKSSGTYYIRNIEGYNGSDKFLQINAASTLNLSNAIIHKMGKTLRQNGGTTFKINVTFDRCEIENMDEGIFRTDSYVSTAKITNSRLHNAGDICIGNWASCTSSGITYY